MHRPALADFVLPGVSSLPILLLMAQWSGASPGSRGADEVGSPPGISACSIASTAGRSIGKSRVAVSPEQIHFHLVITVDEPVAHPGDQPPRHFGVLSMELRSQASAGLTDDLHTPNQRVLRFPICRQTFRRGEAASQLASFAAVVHNVTEGVNLPLTQAHKRDDRHGRRRAAGSGCRSGKPSAKTPW